jgi:hypothetical protein
MAREQKDEKAKKAKLGKAGGSSQADKMEVDGLEDEEFDLSQSNQANSK